MAEFTFPAGHKLAGRTFYMKGGGFVLESRNRLHGCEPMIDWLRRNDDGEPYPFDIVSGHTLVITAPNGVRMYRTKLVRRAMNQWAFALLRNATARAVHYTPERLTAEQMKKVDEERFKEDPRPAIEPPTFQDFEGYIRKRGLKLDARFLYLKYMKRGWRNQKGEPLKDWRLAIEGQNGYLNKPAKKSTGT